MKLIKPSFEIWEQEPGLKGIYKAIERAGRVCYKSENKITEDSAKPFVDRMVKSGHGAMLEHGTVYLKIPHNPFSSIVDSTFRYRYNPYSKIFNCDSTIPSKVYVTTNYRVLIQNNWLDDLKYICKPTEFHEKRITVKFILSRSIAQEYTRHRVFSFAMESQRYCAYNKDKFGNEITYIMPSWVPYREGKYEIVETEDGWGNYNGDIIERNGRTVPENDPDYIKFLYYFINSLNEAEMAYFHLLNQEWKPQQAREVLPNACKTELVMTGFVSQWRNFFDLRCPADAHPSARELAIPLKEEFIKRGYINE